MAAQTGRRLKQPRPADAGLLSLRRRTPRFTSRGHHMADEVGIVSFGAYVPRLRLQRAAIAAANTWFSPGLRGMARGERSMANWDEDTVTMAVEAARDCLHGVHLASVRALSLASTTHPFD